MLHPLLLALAIPFPELVLLEQPAPGGTARVVRRIESERGARTVVLRQGEAPLDLGKDFFPVGWSKDGSRILGYRLIEDGHDLLAAVPEARGGSGAPAAWTGAPGGFDAAVGALVAAAWRRGRAAASECAPRPGFPVSGPAGCPGWIICVDAGHGGPGAAQWNGTNGDGAGAHGPSGLTEQWVNLRVSDFLIDRLAADPRFAGSFRTRTSETQGVSLPDRVLAAAVGGADLFLSLHHNALPAGTPNRTEAYYCRVNSGCTDEPTWRLPARRAHDRIVAAFGYTPRGALEDSSGTGRFHFYVLRNSPCISALTEASNLNGDLHEEDLFGRDPTEAHARAEALALHQALLEQFGYPTGVDEEDAGLVPLPGRFQRLDAQFSTDGAGVEIDWAAAAPGRFVFEVFDLPGRRLGCVGDVSAPGGGRLRLPIAPRRVVVVPSGVYWLTVRESGTVVARRRLIHAR